MARIAAALSRYEWLKVLLHKRVVLGGLMNHTRKLRLKISFHCRCLSATVILLAQGWNCWAKRFENWIFCREKLGTGLCFWFVSRPGYVCHYSGGSSPQVPSSF